MDGIAEEKRLLLRQKEYLVNSLERGLKLISDDASTHNLSAEEMAVYQNASDKIYSRLRKKYDQFEEAEYELDKASRLCEEELNGLEIDKEKGEEDNG